MPRLFFLSGHSPAVYLRPRSVTARWWWWLWRRWCWRIQREKKKVDGKIVSLLWPRHELSPVSACFLLPTFHTPLSSLATRLLPRALWSTMVFSFFFLFLFLSLPFPLLVYPTFLPFSDFHSLTYNNRAHLHQYYGTLAHWTKGVAFRMDKDKRWLTL